MWIDRMTDWSGNHVIQGFARQFIERMPPEAVAGPPMGDWGSKDPAKVLYWQNRTTAFHGIVQWAPTLDPERMKLNNQEMLLQAACGSCSTPGPRGRSSRTAPRKGVIFESKAGRQAILAHVVVDTTGDGDMFARAGAAFDTDIEEGDVHHSMNTAWVVGGVDMDRWIDWKIHHPDELRAMMERGRQRARLLPDALRHLAARRGDVARARASRGLSALDVDDMTEVEIRSHRLMEGHTQFFRRHAPGSRARSRSTAPRSSACGHTRRLAGLARIERKDWGDGTPAADEVGISPSISPKFPVVSVPYGCLVPRALDGLLAAGRHISCDANSHGFMREIRSAG
jgi:hypothetical protein